MIFCGSVFANLVRPWVTSEHRFRLPKKDGTETVASYRFANLLITHNGRSVRAGLAQSYGTQGMPMGEYGRACAALYAVPDL